jgi:hypothetical protein
MFLTAEGAALAAVLVGLVCGLLATSALWRLAVRRPDAGTARPGVGRSGGLRRSIIPDSATTRA